MTPPHPVPAPTLAELVRDMQAALAQGQTDRFNELAKRRAHLLQAQATDAPAARRTPLLSADRRETLLKQALADNQTLIQTARACMAETRRKIDKLLEQKRAVTKLGQGYRPPAARAAGQRFSLRG